MEFMKKREPFPSIECFRLYLTSAPDDNEAKFYFSKCLEYEENPDWYLENYELEKMKEAEEAQNKAKQQEVMTNEVNLENENKLSFQDSASKNNSNVSEDHIESIKSFESYNALKNNSSLISNDINRKDYDLSTSNNQLDELASSNAINTNINNNSNSNNNNSNSNNNFDENE